MFLPDPAHGWKPVRRTLNGRALRGDRGSTRASNLHMSTSVRVGGRARAAEHGAGDRACVFAFGQASSSEATQAGFEDAASSG
jgi:hypothetical protein